MVKPTPARLEYCELSTFAVYLGIHAINLETLDHDQDVSMNGKAAVRLANLIRLADNRIRTLEGLVRKNNPVW